MTPVKHPEETLVIGKPENWNEERDGECGGLSVHVGEYGRFPSFTSRWKPDAVDLAILNAGGTVELQIVGQVQHPVVSLACRAADPNGSKL